MTATLTRPLTVTEAIQTRRSIRKFAPEPINPDDLSEILRLASLAPTANNVQPTRFAVIQDPELQARLQEAAYGQTQVTSAPAVIVVYSDMEDVLNTAEETVHPGMGEEQIKTRAAGLRKNFESQDVAQRGQWGLTQANIAFGFLMLAARGLGYDTVPMLGFDPQKVRDLLGLPEHVQFAGMLPIGKRAEEGFPHHRHSVERVATFY
ncbi:nitroreductase family protein [Deinococcus metallilatus]|uniref:Nitroreductase n=1 Tax=Deinococcus metallilatus TaxID=1211322 RepID=A0AAJ5F3S9_9DEIO|nr:nitroreductase family protein [Deinococcus metallilatus]MBB5294864.1 nitroreductase [Deinococcus metallilatus]QBY09421.1 nitroreductase family protein [Deinococcus metallilatus]RXJ09426.1 nitroreductase family protein [Deinococcus metallilatus]TLK28949.1 nitroreductase family protein [Deinococcus metallilatus]GMA16791.1 nitroreductase [Deinococcus metallilatus]